MKIDRLLAVFLITLALIWGCTASKSTTNNQRDSREVVDTGYGLAMETDVAHGVRASRPNEKAPSNRSLEDMIRGLYGVSVTGTGNNISIRISGVGSFSGNNEPLFVINGAATSMNFAQVAASMNPNEVTSITALKGADAGIYGSRGANGVILIRTR